LTALVERRPHLSGVFCGVARADREERGGQPANKRAARLLEDLHLACHRDDILRIELEHLARHAVRAARRGCLLVRGGRYGEIWGDMGRYGEIWLPARTRRGRRSRRCLRGEDTNLRAGDMGRYGEIWGDMGSLRGEATNLSGDAVLCSLQSAA